MGLRSGPSTMESAAASQGPDPAPPIERPVLYGSGDRVHRTTEPSPSVSERLEIYNNTIHCSEEANEKRGTFPASTLGLASQPYYQNSPSRFHQP